MPEMSSQVGYSAEDSLLTPSFSVIFKALVFVLCFLVEILCAMFDDGVPRVVLFLPPEF